MPWSNNKKAIIMIGCHKLKLSLKKEKKKKKKERKRQALLVDHPPFCTAQVEYRIRTTLIHIIRVLKN